MTISLPKTTSQKHSRQIQKKVSPLPLRRFPQVLVNNEVPMHFYIKRFPLLHDFSDLQSNLLFEGLLLKREMTDSLRFKYILCHQV